MKKVVCIVLFGIGLSMSAMATPVPEIDPASGISAIALLSGALVMIRGRRKK